MSKLLKGSFLISGICSIIEDTEKYMFIACPFLTLHHHYKESLKVLMKKHYVNIKILYGKFSNNDHFELDEKDLEFLKKLPNIEIRYNSKLHAKYYASEKHFITTSLNMNYSSHNTNFEYGILFPSHLSGENSRDDNIAEELHSYMTDIYNESEVIFSNVSKENKSKENGSEVSEWNIRMDEIKAEYPNAYERWTLEDDSKLETLYQKGQNVKELAKIFGRQQSAIRSRINKLDLIEKFGY